MNKIVLAVLILMLCACSESVNKPKNERPINNKMLPPNVIPKG